MNLIRVALFAVFAFMGTFSLSAQNGWLPPAQAIVVLNNELNLLFEPPVPSPTNGVSSKEEVLQRHAVSGVGCSDCQIRAIKEAFIMESLLRIKQGMETGPAVDEVRSLFITAANNNLSMLNSIQTVYVYMETIL